MRRRYGLLSAAFVAVVAVVYAESVLQYVRMPLYIRSATIEPQSSVKIGLVEEFFTVDVSKQQFPYNITVIVTSKSNPYLFNIDVSTTTTLIKYNSIEHSLTHSPIRFLTFHVSPRGDITVVDSDKRQTITTIPNFERKKIETVDVVEMEIINYGQDDLIVQFVSSNDKFFYVAEVRQVTTTAKPSPPPPPVTQETPKEEEATAEVEATTAKSKPAVPYAIIGVVIGGVFLSLITLGIGVFVGRKCTKGAQKEEDEDDDEKDDKTEKKSSQKEKTSENSKQTKKDKKEKKKKESTPKSGIEKLKAKRQAQIDARKAKKTPPVTPADSSAMLHKTNLDSNQTWLKE